MEHQVTWLLSCTTTKISWVTNHDAGPWTFHVWDIHIDPRGRFIPPHVTQSIRLRKELSKQSLILFYAQLVGNKRSKLVSFTIRNIAVQTFWFWCFRNRYNSPIAVKIFVTFFRMVTIAIFMYFKLREKENQSKKILIETLHTNIWETFDRNI